MGTSVEPPAAKQQSMRRAMAALDRAPRFSPSTNRLLARLTHPHCDIRELAELIEKDALLSAQVLQVANSAVFARRSHVASVRHALAMVGLNTIRKFALARSISNLFSRCPMARTFSVTRFNLHSVAVGTMMELLVDEIPLADPGDAFFAGLFHDVGKLLIAAGMPAEHENILMLAAISDKPLVVCEHDVLGVDHAELSGLAIRRWGLAEPVLTAAIEHHTPPGLDPDGRIPLSLALERADAMVNSLGMSVLPPRSFGADPPALRFPGVEVDQRRLFHRFEVEWKSFHGMFD